MPDGRAVEGSVITETVNERLRRKDEQGTQGDPQVDRNPPRNRMQVHHPGSGPSIRTRLRNFLLAAGIATGGAAVVDATGVAQVPGVHEALGTAGEMLKSRPELKRIEEVKPDYILKGTVILKKGVVLRSEPVYPINANTGDHNSVDFAVLGDGDEQHFENPEVVTTWDNKLQFIIRSKDGGAVFTPYNVEAEGLQVSKNAILLEAMEKVEHGRMVYFARGIPPSEVGVRTGPLEAPSP